MSFGRRRHATANEAIQDDSCPYGEAYLRRLYRESRKALLLILAGKTLPPKEPFPSDPATQEETLATIRSLIMNDEQLEGARRMLEHYFPGNLGRVLRLPARPERCQPLAEMVKLREALERHMRLHQEDLLDSDDCKAMEELKKSSRLQQQLAYLVNYTPNKWLLEQEIPVVEASRARRLQPKANADGSEGGAEEGPSAHPYRPGSDPFVWSRDHGRLSGLSLSGGGIRSATFNLGVLQGLASRNLLRRFDYCSSVSGGGYIHEWLAAWIKREEKANEDSGGSSPGLDAVCQHLIPLPDEGSGARHPEAIRWLRRYSNYLTPEKGWFSADTWVTVAIWLRNTMLNQLILLSLLMGVLMLPHAILLHGVTRLVLSRPGAIPDRTRQEVMGWLLGAGAVSMLVVLWNLGRALRAAWQRRNGDEAETASARHAARHRRKSEEDKATSDPRATPNRLFWCVITPGTIAALALSVFGFAYAGMGEQWRAILLCSFCFVGMTAENLVVNFAGGVTETRHEARLPTGWGTRFGFVLAAVVSALIATGGILLLRNLFATGSVFHFYGSHHAGILGKLSSRVRPESRAGWRLAFAFGPSLILITQFVSVILNCGLIGINFKDWVLEWMARLRAWVFLYCMVWAGVAGIALFGREIVDAVVITSSGWIKWPAVGAWVATTVASLVAGKSARSSGDQPGGDASWMTVLVIAGPPLYMLGLLLGLAWVAEKALVAVAHMTAGAWYHEPALVLTILIPLGIGALFGWRVDVNEFSMHTYYRNRLARCYLGASNPSRTPDPLTGFDGADVRNMQLSSFLPARGYTGPFPVFCSSLNISMGEDLAWQERKAASFAFTPLYSGYHVPWTERRHSGELSYNGFVPTKEFVYPNKGINISTAAAVSGAAISPNWGYHTSTPMAFLLTMFNLRLGWWIANPRRSYLAFDPCERPASAGEAYPRPRFAPLPLISELLGRVGDDRKFVNLTDGGHFDNMGLYELVRRRCYEIVICDAEEDRGPVFEGIGMSIRKCRVDFGVEIDLDLNQLAHDATSGLSRVHWITGTIRYPETGHSDEPDKVGRLVYIKSSITGQEAADVYNYHLENANFPQDSTLDQWFSESQFESYRRLGQQVISECPYLGSVMGSGVVLPPPEQEPSIHELVKGAVRRKMEG